mmetsp:Transcript_20444/g.33871  ORF Transcript_20444/g.33871 Transcript_20444/m.33871 type:complete len:253 (+) Transcript_20444:111-869(+)
MSEAVPTTERSGLLDPSLVGTLATGGTSLVNASAEKIKKARSEGPLTYRVMAFIGGLAMIASNGIAILDRFFSFRFASAMIALYNCVFGILIATLEGPGVCSRPLGKGIRYYCKFLEFTWGRGLLYFFCGSLQIANVNMLDWAVGGWMIFVGITAIGVGIATRRQLRLLKFSVTSEEDLKEKWTTHDTNGDNALDIKELTAFVEASGIGMSRNEVAATFMALDRNFDDKIAFEEFYSWWMNSNPGSDKGMSV